MKREVAALRVLAAASARFPCRSLASAAGASAPACTWPSGGGAHARIAEK